MKKKTFCFAVAAVLFFIHIGPSLNTSAETASFLQGIDSQSITKSSQIFSESDKEKPADQSNGTETGQVVVPCVTSGVKVEIAQEYMGFRAIVDKDGLPSGMESFRKMAVTVCREPFNAAVKGFPASITSWACVHPNNTDASIVQNAGTWYILVVLCDDNNQALGCYETAIEVTAPAPVFAPQAAKGVKVKAATEIHGIRATVNRSKLPSDMKDYAKMAVSICTEPFDVQKNGLPNNITNIATVYPEDTYATAVQKSGKWYVLVVFCDSNNQALGYYETSVYVPYVHDVKAQLITSGITVENAVNYTGYEIKIDRSSLPEWAQGYAKIGLSASYMREFKGAEDVNVFGLNSILTYNEAPDGITTIGNTAAAMKWNVLIALFDKNNDPIGYLNTSVDVLNNN